MAGATATELKYLNLIARDIARGRTVPMTAKLMAKLQAIADGSPPSGN